jgi:hypothetical protein
MTFFKITFFLFLFSPLHAQIADLMANDSITWIAEWNADYLIDDLDAEESCSNNRIYVLKYLNTKEGDSKIPKNFFSNCLWDAVQADKIKVFSDSFLTKKLMIHLTSVSAMKAIRNEFGDWMYDYPLFFRKTDD